jgi:hypothetical protein
MGRAECGIRAGRCGALARERSAAAGRAESAVQLHERTVGKLLRKLAFRRLSASPQHPQQARGTGGFQRDLVDLMTAALPAEAAAQPVETRFTDEARAGRFCQASRQHDRNKQFL